MKSLVCEIESCLRGSRFPFNGVAYLACGEEVLLRQAYDQEQTLPAGEMSQFLIGSLSKQITAALTLRAVEKGRMALDTNLGEFFPHFREGLREKITIHHLLNHTSGIQEGGLPLLFPPGTQFAYSNIGYDLLGELLEKVTQVPFLQLVQDLFSSLSSSHMTLGPSSGTSIEYEKTLPNLARRNFPYRWDAKENPSGGLISTAGDLHRWTLALHQGEVLQQHIYRKMITPTTIRENRWGRLGYGYGLQLLQSEGIDEISHNGLIVGFASTLLYYPSSKTTLILLENLTHLRPTRDLTPTILERIFHTQDQIRLKIRKILGSQT